MIRSLLTRAALFTLVLFSFTPTIQAVDWAMYQKDASRNGIVPEDSVLGRLETRFIKHTTLGSLDQPLYYNNIFYYLDYTNAINQDKIWTITAAEANGNILWQQSGIGPIRSEFTIGGNTVLIPGKSLIALNAQSGQKLWEAGGSNYGFSFPLVHGGQVFALKKMDSGSHVGLLSFNLETGAVNWQYTASMASGYGLSIYKDNILATTSDSNNNTRVYSFNAISGTHNWTYIRSYNPMGPAVIDEAGGFGFVIGTNGLITQINLTAGQKVTEKKGGPDPTLPLLIDGKAYYLGEAGNLGNQGVNLYCFDYVNNSFSVVVKIDKYMELWNQNMVLIGEKLYFPTRTGELWSFNPDGTDIQKTTVNGQDRLRTTSYADGVFLILNAVRTTIYAVSSEPIRLAASSSITLNSPYKTDGDYHEYLGQTHSHYVPDLDDWSYIINDSPTPFFTEKLYKEAGYDFMALTEHDKVTRDPGVSGILHITDAEEDTHSPDNNHILAIGVIDPVNEQQGEQERIDEVVNQGGIAILAHPNSKDYPWSIESLKQRTDYVGVEVSNGATERLNFIGRYGSSFAFDKFDVLSSENPDKKIWLTAGDDYTPGNGGFDNAAIVVLSKSLGQYDILQNIKDGNFYAAQGSQAPRIKVTTNGLAVSVNSNTMGDIKFIGNGGRLLKKEDNVLSSTYIVKGNEKYVRAEVTANKKTSWSQPISVADNRAAASFIAGSFKFDLGQGQLESNNTSGVQASTLSTNQYPNQSPPYGYISPIYSFNSDGQVLNGTELTISYVNQALLTNEDNLSIYTYDEPTSTWQKVACTIDKAAKTVKANLSHFSIYTLSAEMTEDSENPTVNLLEPTDLSNLEGNINLTINAQDNNAVFRVMTMIDDKFISSDSDPLDGWSATFNTNDLDNGSHTLTLIAEDPAGNIGEASYQFTIEGSSFIPPTIIINTPDQNAQVNNQSLITGTFASQNPVESIGIFLDDYYLKDATITENTYDQIIDWSEIKEGSHTLKAVLVDEKGNTAIAERNITVGIKVSYDDVRDMIRLFLEQGKIKNKGIAEALLANLSVMEKWDKLGNMALVEKHYRHVVSFIDQQVNLPKPHIDGAAGNTLKTSLLNLINQR